MTEIPLPFSTMYNVPCMCVVHVQLKLKVSVRSRLKCERHDHEHESERESAVTVKAMPEQLRLIFFIFFAVWIANSCTH